MNHVKQNMRRKTNMPETSGMDDYLNAAMVQDGDVVIITSGGIIAEFERDGGGMDKRIQPEVMLPNGDEVKWTMNNTTRRAIAAEYGSNSDEWVGKCVEVQINTQMVRGSRKKVVYGVPCNCPQMQQQTPLQTE
jgi:hypothetical protein